MSRQPTAYEQYFLELVNWARANPAVQAARFGIDLNESLAPGTIDATPKQPLAFDPFLIAAARGHSQWMLDTNVFSHTGIGGSSPGDRMTAAGYLFEPPFSWGENIGWNGNVSTVDLMASVVMSHEGLFKSAGHRVNLLNGHFEDAGIGVIAGSFLFNGFDYDIGMATQKFAQTARGPALTGVAFVDGNRDRFYDIGEGIGGASVVAIGSAGRFETATWDAGGFTLRLPSGTYDVTVSALGRQITNTVSVGLENVKLDLEFSVAAPPPGVPGAVYRFYNEATGVHFYTASVAERDLVITSLSDFAYEGAVFAAPGGTGVHRFWNTETGTHFYTISETERGQISLSLPAFRYEGVAYEAYLSEAPGLIALHRFYNTQTGTHFYTADVAEQQHVAENLSAFLYEGVAYWVAIA